LPPASFRPPGVVSTKQLPPDGCRLALMNSPALPSVRASHESMWPLMAMLMHFLSMMAATRLTAARPSW
jgi:hypothetical protein